MARRTMREEAQALRRACLTVFGGPDGQAVLEHLRRFARAGHSVWTRETTAMELAHTEGRRAVVFEIERILRSEE